MDASLQKSDLIPLRKGQGTVGAHFNPAIVGKSDGSHPFSSPDLHVSEDWKMRSVHLPPLVGLYLDAYVSLGHHLPDGEAFLVAACRDCLPSNRQREKTNADKRKKGSEWSELHITYLSVHP